MVNEGDIVTAERLTKVETKIDFLIAQIDRLPPSPVCVTEHKVLHVRIDDTHTKLNERVTVLENWKNRAIGVLLVFNLFLAVVMTKITNWLFR